MQINDLLQKLNRQHLPFQPVSNILSPERMQTPEMTFCISRHLRVFLVLFSSDEWPSVRSCSDHIERLPVRSPTTMRCLLMLRTLGTWPLAVCNVCSWCPISKSQSSTISSPAMMQNGQLTDILDRFLFSAEIVVIRSASVVQTRTVESSERETILRCCRLRSSTAASEAEISWVVEGWLGHWRLVKTMLPDSEPETNRCPSNLREVTLAWPGWGLNWDNLVFVLLQRTLTWHWVTWWTVRNTSSSSLQLRLCRLRG